MHRPRTAHLGLLLLLLATGCMDRDLVTAPPRPGEVMQSISGGPHRGVEGFYFLPPVAERPAYSGTFDAGLSPVVQVCETPACTSLHASFSRTEGSGSERMRLDEDGEHYIVNWHTGGTDAATGQSYRVRVLVNGLVLGYTDVAVVSTAREAVSIRADGSIALVATQTLPVRFRIETGIVGAVVVSPAEATIDVGATQQFSATLQDLHGELLVGPTVTWWSDAAEVATMSADGLATGLADGAATITASAGAASGSARLTVSGSPVVAAWHAMGAGMDGGGISALAVYDGDLIAGGGFTIADGHVMNHIARWDGSAWHSLAAGMGGPSSIVSSLTVHEGDLIAGGRFTTAGGQAVNSIARWDGSAWHPMGVIHGVVSALTVHQGDLIAGGDFIIADGQTTNRIARWDGSAWQPMGVGINGTVFVLSTFNGDLIAGGQFAEAGGLTANRIARWDGSAWHPMRGGANSHVRGLAIDNNGDLIVGGPFTQVDGKTSMRIARWDGLDWHTATGTDNQINDFAFHNGDLIAGGVFTAAGGQTANRIARWDGAAWNPMGTGMNDVVWALAIYEGDLIAGGWFTTADGQTANRIARWRTP